MKIRSAVTAATSVAAVAGLVLAGAGSVGAGASTASRAGGNEARPTAHAHATAAASSSLAALYKKAVAAKQNSVVIYGPSAGSDGPLYAAFKKEFPKITVTGVPVVGPPMSAKLAAEFASGKHVADIAYTGSTNMLQYAAQGWLKPFVPSTAPAVARLPAGAVGPRNTFYGVTDAVAGIVYNKSEIKASAVPTTWAGFESSKWDGKLGMYDPTAIGEMADVFAHLAKVPGLTKLMADLHNEKVEIYPATNVTGPLTDVAEGAKEIGLEVSYAFYMIAQAKGAPVGFSLLKADNYTTILYQGQVKGAPDPLASELYEDWLFTPQAAKVIASEGAYSLIPNAVAPKGLPAFKALHLMPYIPLSDIGAVDNAAITKSKKYWGS